MRVPNSRQAQVDKRKIHGYLLSTSHAVGRTKEPNFTGLGYSRRDWKRLAIDLVRHLRVHRVAQTSRSAHGTKYVVRGSLRGPSGQRRTVTAVWMIHYGERFPRFVTAYPA